MSRITHYALLHSCIEFVDDADSCPPMAELNRRLSAETQQVFARVDHHAGGDKVFSDGAWLLAGNFVPVDLMIETTRDIGSGIAWREPDALALLVRGEDDNRWRMLGAAELGAIEAPMRP